ncbi:MAG TPA: hypothetical protein VJO35_18250 [Terriglobales bacterium]|nr:hypothetical protein [Terriglobales bacterium]
MSDIFGLDLTEPRTNLTIGPMDHRHERKNQYGIPKFGVGNHGTGPH